jgi:diguanylate cyclase (GGDEF)-like protein/PAS domain S-box-containing protein
MVERIQIAADQQRSEARSGILFDLANDGLLMLDMKGHIIDINTAGHERLGYAKKEMLGKRITQFDPPEFAEQVPKRFAEIRSQGSAVFETAHVRKDGTVMPVEISAKLISMDGEDYIFGVVRDITERKEYEEQIQFQTNICRALFYTNQAALVSKTECDLFNKICQIAVEFGGMMLAWIGRADEQSGLIKVEARYGTGQSYLDGIEISSRADLPKGQGCTGVAFREHRTVISRDFSTSPSAQPWHDRAKPYGWRASAAVGITRGGRSYAVISFYHQDRDAFSEPIVQLLAEMARNVSYALDRFDLEDEKHEVLRSLEQNAGRYQKIIQTSLDGFWMIDMGGRILEVNEAYVRRSGYGREELLQLCVWDVEALMEKPLIKEILKNLAMKGYARFETKHRAKDGGVWPVEVNAVYLPEDGRILGFMRDMTDHRRSEDELRIAASVFQSQEAMMVTDSQRRIIRVNQAFTMITGYSSEDVIGQDPRILQSGVHAKTFYREMWEKINRDGIWQGEIWDKRKNGEVYPKWLTISVVKDRDEQVTHYVGSFVDLKEYKEAQNKIENLAFYDQLTGLPNRSLLLERLEHALDVSSRAQRYGAILCLDLDHFKVINDTQGHDVGDEVLQETARRIEATLRSEDTVVRIGGDEFVVILEQISQESQHAAAQAKLVGDKLLGALGRDYTVNGKDYLGSVSIGVTLFRDSRDGVHELLKRGDLAMYAAKKAGRNTLRFYDPAMQETLERRTQLEFNLRHALEERQMVLYYQKRVGNGGRVRGAEVLLRWIHPQLGLISPLDFIPLAEETGLIIPIGKWVLEESCRRLKAWSASEKMRQLMLSVNISALEFKQPNFVDNIMRLLDETGVNPSLLALEITESMLLDNMEEFIGKMRQLRDIGLSFALDDFGTGYSCLSYLKTLPINELKIDKSFIKDLGMDKNGEAIVQTIIQMGKTLGMDVIAEGVETQTHCELLGQFGCHNFQGYLFGRPEPLEIFEQGLV